MRKGISRYHVAQEVCQTKVCRFELRLRVMLLRHSKPFKGDVGYNNNFTSNFAHGKQFQSGKVNTL